MIRGLSLLALAAFAAAVPVRVASGAQIPVTTTADTIANDGLCSLREAVFAARFNALVSIGGCTQGSATETDVVTLGAGTYELLPGPSGSEDGNESGDLDTGPTSALRIVGGGQGVSIIDPLLGDRAFDVFSGSSLGLQDLTIRRGRAPAASSGGAVRNQGTLTVSRVSFEGNQAGAGISRTPGSLSGGDGGAIWSGNAAVSVLVGESTFTANAGGDGAPGFTEGNAGFSAGSGGLGSALFIGAGTAEISGSTFSGNRAGDGGPREAGPFDGTGGSGALAVLAPASASVVNSTFVGNSAGLRHSKYVDPSRPAAGAAILMGTGGSLRISWSTFAGNTRSADSEKDAANGVANAQVNASIVADAAPACRSVTTAGLPNVVRPGETSCGGPSVFGEPGLGGLAANGGPTPTLLPGPGSIAIDALGGVPCPATDQRGLPRPALGACDAGAVEVQTSAGAPGPSPPPAVAPARAIALRLSGLRLSRALFRSTGRSRRGTVVRFRLTVASRIVLTVKRAAAGRRSGRRCVAPSARLKNARRCTRRLAVRGSLGRSGKAGLNRLRFSGRIGGRPLAPGRYTMLLRLPPAGGVKGAVATRNFRVLG